MLQIMQLLMLKNRQKGVVVVEYVVVLCVVIALAVAVLGNGNAGLAQTLRTMINTAIATINPAPAGP